jgi:outer membrane protein OmpA-like peptidoglycan-associated protein
LGVLLIFGLYNLVDGLFGEDQIEENDPTAIEEPITDEQNEAGKDSVTPDQNESTDEDKTQEEETSEVDKSDSADSEDNDSPEDSSDEKNDSETEKIEITEVDMDKKTEVLFGKNTADLKSSYLLMLDDWYEFLMMHESISIIVEGHINGYPYYDDGDYGLAIAEDRASVIVTYLVDKGVTPSRIKLINMGSKEQVDSSDDTSKHFLNRRAIIYINKNEYE